MKQIPRILIPLLLLILLTAIILPVSGTQLPGTVFGGAEKPSPSQWIPESNISVFPSKVIGAPANFRLLIEEMLKK